LSNGGNMSNGTSCGWVKVANLPEEAVPDVGNVVADPTTPPTAGQLARWVDGKTIGGLDFPTSPPGALQVKLDGSLVTGPNFAQGTGTAPLLETYNAANISPAYWKLATGGTHITTRASGLVLAIFMGLVKHTTANAGVAVAIAEGPMPFPQTGSVIQANSPAGWNVSGAWDPVTCVTPGYYYQYSNMLLFWATRGQDWAVAPVMWCANAGTASLWTGYLVCFELG
jgi:hypothetical protein